ncbi:MAG: chromate transporter [Oscillospiraceae bacterium]|nr:chromate transporter [Candidatus Equicaccousia limihippi]
MTNLLKLYIAFFKIGLMTFDGGYAMLPFLQKELVDKRGWTDKEELLNVYAVGQCTPGVIAVNTSTYIGYKREKVWGGIFATAGMVTPSIIIITLVALLLNQIASYPIVQHAFNGIQVAVVVLIINAVIKLFKSAVTDIYTVIIFAVCAVCCYFLGVNPLFILAAGAIGILLRGRKADEK